jgi:DNA-binding beta-propeller fold protein YncE
MPKKILLLALLALAGCGGKRDIPVDELRVISDQKRPVGLVPITVIQGRMGGYELSAPAGVAVDQQGNVYISDTGNHRLIKLDTRYQLVRDFGGFGSGVGKFNNPEDLTVDRLLNLYVIDTNNRRIVHLDVQLNYVDEFEPEDDPKEVAAALGKFSGIYVSPTGEMTVADYDNSRLLRMDNFGRFSRYIGDFSFAAGSLLNPLGLAGTKNGTIYVADAGNERLAIYDHYGNYVDEMEHPGLHEPSAVAISPAGTIWTCDQISGALFAFAPHGEMLFSIGRAGREEFAFSDPQALAVSPDNHLLVADTGNDRIMVYRIIYEEP